MRATEVRILPRPPPDRINGEDLKREQSFWIYRVVKSDEGKFPVDRCGRRVSGLFFCGGRFRWRAEHAGNELRCVRQTELAWVAQLVERVLGKDEVTGSIPVPGSRGCGGGLGGSPAEV